MSISSCTSHCGNDVHSRLSRWDNILWTRTYEAEDSLPKQMLDSLNAIDVKRLSKNDEAYYYLILSIINDKIDKPLDTVLINYSLTYYKGVKDELFNYARALYYGGLAMYRVDNRDTAAFSLFKLAEEITNTINQQGVGTIKLNGQIHSYLGLMLMFDKNFVAAEHYFDKALRFFDKCNERDNYYINYIFKAWCVLLENKVDSAKILIDKISKDEHSKIIKTKIYNIYSSIYLRLGEPDKSIFYRIKQIEAQFSENDVANYYSLSKYYLSANLPDSAVKYGQKTLELSDTSDVNRGYYYLQLAQSLRSAKLESMAYDTLYKAIHQIEKNMQSRINKEISKIQSKYDYVEKEIALEREKSKTNYLLLSFGLFLFLGYSVVLYYKKKMAIEEKKKIELKKSNDEMKIAYESVSKSGNLVYYITKQLKKNSNKHITDTTIFYEYEKLLSNIEVDIKKRNSELAKILREIASSEEKKKISILTDKETIIYLALINNYQIETIAKIMNITPENIRATICRIEEKLSQKISIFSH